jgi:hypothetical protein
VIIYLKKIVKLGLSSSFYCKNVNNLKYKIKKIKNEVYNLKTNKNKQKHSYSDFYNYKNTHLINVDKDKKLTKKINNFKNSFFSNEYMFDELKIKETHWYNLFFIKNINMTKLLKFINFKFINRFRFLKIFKMFRFLYEKPISDELAHNFFKNKLSKMFKNRDIFRDNFIKNKKKRQIRKKYLKEVKKTKRDEEDT